MQYPPMLGRGIRQSPDAIDQGFVLIIFQVSSLSGILGPLPRSIRQLTFNVI